MFASLLRLFRSVKLAIVLLLLLALGGMVGGLLPQQGPGPYLAHGQSGLSHLLGALGFYDFFHSAVFYAVAGLFVLNLGCCAVYRFSRQLRRGSAGRRFGPDILHLGLLVLVIGAIVGSLARRDFDALLSKGDTALLPDGRLMRLLDFEYKAYPDGRPQAWISTVELMPKSPGLSPSTARIEVNHPLRLGGLSIYQMSYAKEPSALFEGPSESRFRLFGGESASLDGGRSLLFMGESGEGSAKAGVFLLGDGTGGTRLRLGAGQSLAGWRLVELATVDVTGLRASEDPGFPIVMAGFLVIAAGLALTYFQKIKDATRC